MKIKSKAKSFTAALAGIVIMAFLLPAIYSEEKKEFIFTYALNPVIRNTSFGGKGSAEFQELFQNGADEFHKLYGYTLTLKIYPAPKFLYKAMQDKTVDFGVGYLDMFLHAKNMGLPVMPFLGISTLDTKEDKYCIFTHKNSGIKTIKQLQGKRFVVSFPVFTSKKDALPPKESYIWWIMIKKILAQNGVNKPFKNFFKEFAIIPAPWESVAYSVLFKRFDAFQDSMGSLQTYKNYDAGFSDIVPVACIAYPASSPLFCRKDAPPEPLKKLTDVMLHPQKTKEIKKSFKSFKGLRFFTVKEKDYDIYFQWLKEAEQKGWLKEFNALMKEALEGMKKKTEKPF